MKESDFLHIKKPVYLVQTDTTVGFLCKSQSKLNQIKKRDLLTPCVQAVSSFKELKDLVHVPKKYKNFIRKSKKTTFIYPNKKSVRVVKDNLHELFLREKGALYSTSANITSKTFDENYAREVADEVVECEGGFFEAKPSKIYKIGKTRMIKVRI